MNRPLFAMAVVVSLNACGGPEMEQSAPPPPQVTCGAGTELRDGVCEAVAPPPMPAPPPPTVNSLLNGFANVSFGTEYHYSSATGSTYIKRLVITDLGYQSATAFADLGSNMIGTGIALHITGTELSSSGARLSIISSGNCPNGVGPTTYPIDSSLKPLASKAYGALYGWKNGVPTMQRCITSGIAEIDSQGLYITLTAQFDDGTVWSDKTFRVGPRS